MATLVTIELQFFVVVWVRKASHQRQQENAF